MKKTLIINDVAPPVVQGGAILLGKLFKEFPLGSISIFTENWSKRHKLDPNLTLKFPYFFIAFPEYEGKQRWLRRFLVGFQLVLLPVVVCKGISIVIKNRIDNIFAPVNRGFFLIAAFLISKLTQKRFFVYSTDIYEGLTRTTAEKLLAKIFGRSIFCHASGVFVVNDFMFNYYKNKYKIEPVILPNPVDLNLYQNRQGNFLIPKNSRKQIVFTGMVYWAQLDALKNLTKALADLENNVRLFIYSPFSRQYLENLGISGKNVTFSYAQASDIPFIQKSADILFLPMTFNSVYPLVTKTASTTKLAEYLAAGRPILVHAPSDCFLSYYAKKEGFGYVVNNLDKEELKGALLRVLEDQQLQDNLIKNAQRTVSWHDLKVVSGRLQNYLL